MPTTESKKRRKDDAYMTPRPLAMAIVKQLRADFPLAMQSHLLLEPSAGDGAFVEALSSDYAGERVVAVDLNPMPNFSGGVRAVQADFLDQSLLHLGAVSAVVGNPPYLHAEAFVHRALEVVMPGGIVAFLLRCSFRFGKKRLSTLHRKVNHVATYRVFPRPSFTDDGKTDGSEYCVFVWHKGGINSGLVHEVDLTWDRPRRSSGGK